MAVMVDSLSEREKEVMSIVLDKFLCGAWVAKDSAEVLTLLYKGILLKISDEEKWADWKFAELEWNGQKICILVAVPDFVAHTAREL